MSYSVIDGLVSPVATLSTHGQVYIGAGAAENGGLAAGCRSNTDVHLQLAR